MSGLIVERTMSDVIDCHARKYDNALKEIKTYIGY